eukprot:COSAG01_NODE_14736_length_1416_cov_5.009871_2_plen_168_part_00
MNQLPTRQNGLTAALQHAESRRRRHYDTYRFVTHPWVCHKPIGPEQVSRKQATNLSHSLTHLLTHLLTHSLTLVITVTPTSSRSVEARRYSQCPGVRQSPGSSPRASPSSRPLPHPPPQETAPAAAGCSLDQFLHVLCCLCQLCIHLSGSPQVGRTFVSSDVGVVML